MNRAAALSLLAASLFACRTASVPAGIPRGYEVTPNGLVHRSCIRIVPDGHSVAADGVITSPTGERTAPAPCRHPRLDPRTLAEITYDSAGGHTSSWVISAGWHNTPPLGFLRATFVVPPGPQDSSVTIYLFPSMTPAKGGPILQNVLGWQPGIGWRITSGICCPPGSQNWSRHLPVNTGDTITAYITWCPAFAARPEQAGAAGRPASARAGSAHPGSAASCDWLVLTTDNTTGQSVSLAVNDTTPVVNAGGGALEAYSFTACDQLPGGGTIAFTNIELRDQNGNVLQPDWSPHYWDGPVQCNYGITSTATSVTLTWQP
jgi:hypothetical protein